MPCLDTGGDSRSAAEIATAATKGPVASKAAAQKQPPLRFYVYEGYRVFYQVDAGTRRVVVLDLSPAKG